jgi:2-isopropylmalate synthase
MKLTDYTVRVIGGLNADDGEALAGTGETARRVRVTIQSQDEDGNNWGTVAVSRNILAASWAALVDAFEYKRLLDMKKHWGMTPSDDSGRA